MSIKIATPISELFVSGDKVQIERLIELSDALEIRDISKEIYSPLPRLYHSDLSIVEKWTEEEFSRVVSTIEKNKAILISFHIVSCFPNALLRDGMFQPTGQKMSKVEMKENAKINVAKLRRGILAEIAIENNNYFPTGAYDLVTEAAFINELLRDNNLKLLLDLAHSKITAYHRNFRIDEYIKTFDLDRVIQMHLSGIKKTGKLCEDAHLELKDQDWDELIKTINFCPNLEFITIEYYRKIPVLLEMLNKLKKILNEKNSYSSS